MFRVTILLFTLAVTVLTAACASPGSGGSGATTATPAVVAPVYEVTARSLNVRDSPGGVVVGSLAQGARVEAPLPAEGAWLYVESETGTTGYVSTKYVRAVEGATPIAAREAAPPPEPEPERAPEPPPEETQGRPPIPGSPLSKIELGMSEAEVISILGEPTSQENYQTGKAWIPYYYGSDTSRLDYKYKNVGLVVFGRNRYSGRTRVIRVDYDPNEDGF